MKTIVFEGVNGSGKTTQAKLLENRMEKIHKPCLSLTPNNTDTTYDAIRQFTKRFIEFDGMRPVEALLFAAYLQHQSYNASYSASLEQWAPDVCILDRYISSLEVYQGYIKDVDVSSIIRFAIRYFHVPDLTIVLGMDPKVAMDRVVRREQEAQRLGLTADQSRDYFDVTDERYYIRSSAAFAALAESGRCALGSPIEVVNANGRAESVHEEIMQLLYNRRLV